MASRHRAAVSFPSNFPPRFSSKHAKFYHLILITSQILKLSVTSRWKITATGREKKLKPQPESEPELELEPEAELQARGRGRAIARGRGRAIARCRGRD